MPHSPGPCRDPLQSAGNRTGGPQTGVGAVSDRSAQVIDSGTSYVVEVEPPDAASSFGVVLTETEAIALDHEGGSLDAALDSPDPQDRVADADQRRVQQPEPFRLGQPQPVPGDLETPAMTAVGHPWPVDRCLHPGSETCCASVAQIDAGNLTGSATVTLDPPVTADVRRTLAHGQALRDEVLLGLLDPVRRTHRTSERVIGQPG